MFSDAQKKDLAAPLSSANVKSRSQAGRSVCYIESWKAIEEANRIFGFDGWTDRRPKFRAFGAAEGLTGGAAWCACCPGGLTVRAARLR